MYMRCIHTNCTFPVISGTDIDYRFFTEKQYQLEPYDVCQITNKVPHRAVPLGCYDTGDGFYSTKTKCVSHPITGKILR